MAGIRPPPEPAAVRRFRTAFADALARGRTGVAKGDAQVTVNATIKALVDAKQVRQCLDRYCLLYDPARPPRRDDARRIAVATGYSLFVRAIELATVDDDLAIMVGLMPPYGAGIARAKPDDPFVVYGTRWRALAPADQQRLLALATAKRKQLDADIARPLLDQVRVALKRPGKRADLRDALLAFGDRGYEAQKVEFARYVRACEVAWMAPDQAREQPSSASRAQAAAGAVKLVFEAFGRFVDRTMATPLDMFRLLKWLRQPFEEANIHHEDGVTIKLRSNLNVVTRELYIEVACRGQTLAATRWKHLPTQRARGLVAEDRNFIKHALSARDCDLLDARLTGTWADAAAHQSSLTLWRQAAVLGRYKFLDILDDVEVVAMSERCRDEWTASPGAVQKRRVRWGDPVERRQQTFWINAEFKGAFNIVWIDADMARAHIVIPQLPDFVFTANASSLANLQDDAFFLELAVSALQLAQFLIFYLKMLGFAFEIGAAMVSGGLSHVVFEFAKNRFVAWATDEAMDAAGIENPYLRTLIGVGAGMASSVVTVGKLPTGLKGLEELEGTISPTIATGVPPPIDDATRGLANEADALQHSAQASLARISADIPEALARGVPQRLSIGERLTASIDAIAEWAFPGVGRAERGLVTAGAESEAGYLARGAEETSAPMMMAAQRAEGSALGQTRRAASGAATRAAKSRPLAAIRAQKLADKLKESALVRESKAFDAFLEQGAKNEAQAAREQALKDLAAGRITRELAEQQIVTGLNRARERTGEAIAQMVINSNYKNARLLLTIPTRGAGGPPIFDLVFTAEKNGRQIFIFVEAKGGLQTQLGIVNNYRYAFKNGALTAEKVLGLENSIRQTSGEWIYQRIAETYMSGAEHEQLARDMLAALRRGDAEVIVHKTSLAVDPTIIDQTPAVLKYFQTTKFNNNLPLPIPVSGVP